MLLPSVQLALMLLLGCSVSVLALADTGLDYVHQNMEKMAELRTRWNRIHPVTYPPLSEEDKALLEKYSKEGNTDHEHVPSIPEINAADADGLIEGDILPSDQDLAGFEEMVRDEESGKRTKRAASMFYQPNFPTNQSISYVISPDYDDHQKDMIRTAIRTIEENTCLRFKENGTGLKLEYSNRASDVGCFSSVGDLRNVFFQHNQTNQLINLGKIMCFKLRIIQHETIHALGFGHTMSRPDREKYIKIDVSYLSENVKRQFDMLLPHNFNNHSVPYEYNSVMHYGASQSSYFGPPTMIPIEEEYITSVGPDHGPTFNDWKQINYRYFCKFKCPIPITCHNQGFQHPVDCIRCTCHIFYSGSQCEHEVNVTNLLPGESKSLSYEMLAIENQHEESNFTKFDKERHVIKAPAGRKIRVTLNKINPQSWIGCMAPCMKQAVEIVDGDMSLVGKRYCCADRTSHWFVSKTNVVGYQVYSMPGFGFSSEVTFSIDPTTDPPTEQPTTVTTTTHTTTRDPFLLNEITPSPTEERDEDEHGIGISPN